MRSPPTTVSSLSMPEDTDSRRHRSHRFATPTTSPNCASVSVSTPRCWSVCRWEREQPSTPQSNIRASFVGSWSAVRAPARPTSATRGCWTCCRPGPVRRQSATPTDGSRPSCGSYPDRTGRCQTWTHRSSATSSRWCARRCAITSAVTTPSCPGRSMTYVRARARSPSRCSRSSAPSTPTITSGWRPSWQRRSRTGRSSRSTAARTTRTWSGRTSSPRPYAPTSDPCPPDLVPYRPFRHSETVDTGPNLEEGSAALHHLAGALRARRHRAVRDGRLRPHRVEGAQPLHELGDLGGRRRLRQLLDVLDQLRDRDLPLAVADDDVDDRHLAGHAGVLLLLRGEQVAYAAGNALADQDDARASDHTVQDVLVLGERDGGFDVPAALEHLQRTGRGPHLPVDLGVRGVLGALAEDDDRGQEARHDAEREREPPAHDEVADRADDAADDDEPREQPETDEPLGALGDAVRLRDLAQPTLGRLSRGSGHTPSLRVGPRALLAAGLDRLLVEPPRPVRGAYEGSRHDAGEADLVGLVLELDELLGLDPPLDRVVPR